MRIHVRVCFLALTIGLQVISVRHKSDVVEAGERLDETENGSVIEWLNVTKAGVPHLVVLKPMYKLIVKLSLHGTEDAEHHLIEHYAESLEHQFANNAMLDLEGYGLIAHWLKLCYWHLATLPEEIFPMISTCPEQERAVKPILLGLAVQASQGQMGIEKTLASGYSSRMQGEIQQWKNSILSAGIGGKNLLLCIKNNYEQALDSVSGALENALSGGGAEHGHANLPSMAGARISNLVKDLETASSQFETPPSCRGREAITAWAMTTWKLFKVAEEQVIYKDMLTGKASYFTEFTITTCKSKSYNPFTNDENEEYWEIVDSKGRIKIEVVPGNIGEAVAASLKIKSLISGSQRWDNFEGMEFDYAGHGKKYVSSDMLFFLQWE